MKQMKRNILYTFLILFSAFGVVTATPKLALACTYENADFLSIPAWYKYLPGEVDASGRCAPTLGGDDADEESKVNSGLAIGIAVLEAVLKLSSLVAVVMIFWGAFKFITSQGSPDNFAKSRQTVINAAVGFAIVLVASQLVAFAGRTIAGG